MKFRNAIIPDIIIRLADISNVNIEHFDEKEQSTININLVSGYRTTLFFEGKGRLRKLYDTYVKIMTYLKKKKQASNFLCIYLKCIKSIQEAVYAPREYVVSKYYVVELLNEEAFNKATIEIIENDGTAEETSS